MSKFNDSAFQSTVESIRKAPASGIAPFHVAFDLVDGVEGTAKVRDFAPIVLDEPENFGGSNLGPNPVEYLLTGAVGCFSIGLALSLAHAGITVKKLHTDLDSSVDFNTMLGLVEGGRHGVNDITLALTIDADAEDETIWKHIRHSLATSPVLNSLNIKIRVLPPTFH